MPLRVLFAMRNLWYVKAYEPVIRVLAARGHHVHILTEHENEGDERARPWAEAARALGRQFANVTISSAPRVVPTEWTDLRSTIRLGLDYLRFCEPEYADTPAMSARARSRAPGWVVNWSSHPILGRRPFRRGLAAVLRTADRVLPVPSEISEPVLQARPDVVVVTPLVELGSDQVDVVRTARRAGIPSVLGVGSWDHLSSKALVREQPDRVLVWNATQRDEAIRWHRIPGSRIVVTGAQSFDQWFDRRPTLERAAFCGKVGLAPDRPYVLYVCSALFDGSPSESAFVEQWLAAVRALGDSLLGDASVLIRPHPKRGFDWASAAVAQEPGVSLWPPVAAGPFDAETKSDYFDSMYHSSVIVGLNTSSLIEGAIVGRPVLTVLQPGFRGSQEGTLHFRYLLDGGLLHVSRDLASHVGQLAGALRDPEAWSLGGRAFIEQFVRPHGLDVAATPRVVEAVEEAAALRLRPTGDPLWVRPARPVLRLCANRLRGAFVEEVQRELRYDEKRRREAQRAAALEAARVERVSKQAEKLATHRAQKLAEVEARRESVLRRKALHEEEKRQQREYREGEKAKRVAQRRRERRERTVMARLAVRAGRLLRPFLSSR